MCDLSLVAMFCDDFLNIPSRQMGGVLPGDIPKLNLATQSDNASEKAQ
jgi:hypothetical protein